MKITIDAKITQFHDLVSLGVDSWVQAGVLLNEILKEDPLAQKKIVKNNPHLTNNVLNTFKALGEKRLYPFLALDHSPGAAALTALPYEEQEKYYQNTISVMVRSGDGYDQMGLTIRQLTNAQVKLVFDGDRIRTPAAQAAILREEDRSSAGKFNLNTTPKYEKDKITKLRKDDNGGIPFDKLDDATPEVLLLGDLGAAQGELMEARRHLAAIQKDSQFDDLITIALTAVGKLRLAVNDGQITKRK